MNSSEHALRLEKLRARLEELGADAAYVSSPANIAYLSGVHITPHERLIALLMPRAGDPRLVVPALEGEASRDNAASIDVLEWKDADGPFGALREAFEDALRAADRPRVVLEKDAVTIALLEGLREQVGIAEVEDVGPFLTELRMAKSAAEIGLIAEAAAILDASLAELPWRIRPGRTEAEVAFELDARVRSKGAEGLPFETIVLTGAAGASPHGTPTVREIREGDLVVVDVGAVKGGYCADVTRTFAAGEPPDRAREVFEVVRRAQEAGRGAVAAGACCEAVDAAARAVIDAAGYGEFFVHRTGHGLGLEVHEPPSLAAGNGLPLPLGAVVTVEPGIYLPGFAGVRIEDDVVACDGGGKSLTSYARELVLCPTEAPLSA
jgi:Xaa-Pro dipeptidase